MQNLNQPIGVSTYAIKQKLPKDYEKFLLSKEKFKEFIKNYNVASQIKVLKNAD